MKAVMVFMWCVSVQRHFVMPGKKIPLFQLIDIKTQLLRHFYAPHLFIFQAVLEIIVCSPRLFVDPPCYYVQQTARGKNKRGSSRQRSGDMYDSHGANYFYWTIMGGCHG